MLKKVAIFTLCIVIVLSIWMYNNQKKNEAEVFEHSMHYIVTKYKEDKNFSNLGVTYNFGRGNYFILLQNDTTNKFYSLEVKLAKKQYIVYIEDHTLNDIYPD
ncbi:hypothetical protein [Psychrobacillus sp.]|uniref:hypothetical protein n=1 Tax=Psychrobacillus sp. TaxID=1871623 RepID=UPI0028BEC16E|nr:hypothetical protein [Psychrobacillus sp.]